MEDFKEIDRLVKKSIIYYKENLKDDLSLMKKLGYLKNITFKKYLNMCYKIIFVFTITKYLNATPDEILLYLAKNYTGDKKKWRKKLH